MPIDPASTAAMASIRKRLALFILTIGARWEL
jgi:hypothetical protein